MAVTGAAVARAASAGAARRLVQSAVVFAVLAASSVAGLLGLTLLTSANQGFLAGCAATHCAHLAVTINASTVTTAELAGTAHLPGVTQAAGPYPQTTITVKTNGGPGHSTRGVTPSGQPGRGARPSPAGGPGRGGANQRQLTVVGRASPHTPLDQIVANPTIMDHETHGKGRWPARPGEISLAILTAIRLPLGSKITVSSAPGHPKLTITGYADQQLNYEDAWVTPGEIAALRATGAPAQEQMLYTFAHDTTAAQINADLAELRHALPAGAIESSQSWLPALQMSSQQNVNTAFVLAFAVLALMLAVLIVANVVSAAVIASYRRIGVLKSIGFTPAQVTTTDLAQIGLPALAGAVAGTALGNWQVLPVIGLYKIQGAHVYVPLWINLAVPLGLLTLTGLAAAVPAIGAGRLSAVQAITAGQAPAAGRGYGPHRLAGRIPLPRPATIGLAAPFTRPTRAAVTLAALAFGLTGVVLGASLYSSIHKINYASLVGVGQVRAAWLGGRFSTLTASQQATIVAAVRAQPGTLHYVGETDLMSFPRGTLPPGVQQPPGPSVTVAGHPPVALQVYAYDGGSAWLGWKQNLVTGHWYQGPHQVDASTALLADTGLKVGDTITLTVNHKPVTARIAGEVFDPGLLPSLFTSWQALGGATAGLGVSHYDINLTPGTSVNAYISALDRALGPGYGVDWATGGTGAGQVDTSYFRLLAMLVAVLAALGVLNSVLMATRERVHDLGVYKAVGMTPRQTLAMVTCSVIPPAVLAAAIALPAGLITQDLLVRHLATLTGLVVPASFIHTLTAADLAGLALAGLGIAIAGALGPATWAATANTATTLRAE
jgi:putative ABC transport system permease protein